MLSSVILAELFVLGTKEYFPGNPIVEGNNILVEKNVTVWFFTLYYYKV